MQTFSKQEHLTGNPKKPFSLYEAVDIVISSLLDINLFYCIDFSSGNCPLLFRCTFFLTTILNIFKSMLVIVLFDGARIFHFSVKRI